MQIPNKPINSRGFQSMFKKELTITKFHKRVKDSEEGEILQVKFNVLSQDFAAPNQSMIIAMVVRVNERWEHRPSGRCEKRIEHVNLDIDNKRFFKRNNPKITVKYKNGAVVIERIMKLLAKVMGEKT